MKYRVVRPFPCSFDGLTLVDLAEGDERDDFGAMATGLVAAGLLAAVANTPPHHEAAPDMPKKIERRRKRG